MITYELAKQLKEAGFSQEGEGKLRYSNKIENMPITDDRFKAEYEEGSVYVPTLSELINGCGNYDFGFWRGGSTKWEAWIRKAEHRGDVKEEICAIGTTPEEAVAGLWLKINNKKLYETKF